MLWEGIKVGGVRSGGAETGQLCWGGGVVGAMVLGLGRGVEGGHGVEFMVVLGLAAAVGQCPMLGDSGSYKALVFLCSVALIVPSVQHDL